MKLKKVMAATLATMMCLSSFSMMNVWADKKSVSAVYGKKLPVGFCQGFIIL